MLPRQEKCLGQRRLLWLGDSFAILISPPRYSDKKKIKV